MTTQVINPSLSIIPPPSQNEHLWKIIEKQRAIIQDLQASLAKVTEQRDVLLKQTSTPKPCLSVVDHYSKQPLPPVETILPAEVTERTPSPNRSIKPHASTPTPTARQTVSSPFELMFSPTQPINISSVTTNDNYRKSDNNISNNNKSSSSMDSNLRNTSNANYNSRSTVRLPVTTVTSPSQFSGFDYSDDETTRKLPPLDEKDIMLYTKYHEAVRSRSASQPVHANSTSAFIAYSPLPPPPQRHGSYAQREPSTSPVSRLSPPRSDILSSSPSSVLSHRQPTYTFRKFMEEDEMSPTVISDDNEVDDDQTHSMPSSTLEMVRYEDDYYDPSLEDDIDVIAGSFIGEVCSPSASQPANAPIPMLADISIQVLSSNMTTNEKGKEIFSFTIAVGKASLASPRGMEELWRTEKLLSDFVNLDQLLKSKHSVLPSNLFRLPDKSLFTSKAPSKVDERKQVIQNYLQQVLNLPLTDMSDVCEFLSTNVLEQRSGPPKRKFGYLTKRGKNFGGWKMRFFVLDGPALKYFENKGGQYLGTINLSRAQIGRQVVQSGSGDAFRHAFLILEPKRSAPNGIHRHVLCADSDLERDQWVEAMSQYIDDGHLGQTPATPTTPDYRQQLNKYLQRSRSDTSSFKKKRKNSAQRHVRQRSSLDEAGLFSSLQQEQDGSPDEDKKNNGNKSRNFWGKKVFNNNTPAGNSVDLQANQVAALMNAGGLTGFLDTSNATGSAKLTERGPNQVFGIPLDEAVQVCRISQDYELPAIVYRCIEYLEAKNASQEEGIYRLSGSAAKIRKLKDKFNKEGDILLLELEEYKHEVHAIAGLLKMWLRELPGSVLTMDLLNEFLHVADMEDREARTTELGRLVSLLPLSNYTLLRTLSAHLIRIVQNAGINKMTLRNLGIVFSATLGIPAVIFNLFLSEFDYVFWTNQVQDIPALTPPNIQSSDVSTKKSFTLDDDVTSTKLSISPATPPSLPPLSIHRTRNNRNSVRYSDYAPQSIVGLEKRSQDFSAIIDEDDEDNTLGIDYDEIVGRHQQKSFAGTPTHEYTATVIEPQIRI